jgi:acylphosphatase
MLVCKQVHYSGRVQGVGFRYTAQSVARGFPVTGYVRNLGNGQVEILAEGKEQDVAACLDAIAEKMSGYITGSQVVDTAPQGFQDFGIRA